MGIPHLFELFSLHLRGRAQDFVEILMALWPRFGLCVCVRARARVCLPVHTHLIYVSLTTASWSYTLTEWRAGQKWSASKNFCHMNFLPARHSIHSIKEKKKKKMKPEKVADERACCCTFRFHCCAVYDNLPLIYTFMKESPLGFWVCCKSCLLWISKGLKSQTDRSRKIEGSSLTVTLWFSVFTDRVKYWIIAFFISICQLAFCANDFVLLLVE